MPIIRNHNRFKQEDQGSRSAMNCRIFVAASVLGALVVLGIYMAIGHNKQKRAPA